MDKTIGNLMKQMGFETTQTRNSDSLDFREVAVWEIKEALEAAYRAGRSAGGKVSS